MVSKKKVVKKKTPVKNNKFHFVVGNDLMSDFEKKCEVGNMSKSNVGRLLVEAFVNGTIKITPAKVTQTKAIRNK